MMKRIALSLLALILYSVGALAACGGGGSNCYWVGGTGTWDNSATTHWSNTSGGSAGVGPPAATDTAIFDASSSGGTVTVAATFNASNTVNQITMGAFTGTLDFSANNPNITMVRFSGSGTGTRTLNMGNGTWTLTSTGNDNTWDYSTTTNLTHAANSSTLVFSSNATNVRQFITGNKNFNAVSIVQGNSNQTSFVLLGATSATFASLSLTPPLSLLLEAGTNLTITNAFAWTGTSSGGIGLLCYIYCGTRPTITAGAASSMTWAYIRGITFATSAVTATNSIDGGGNTGTITITPPSGGSRCIGC